MKKKKSNFIVQGGILAMAGILSRIIGIARRFPMQHIFGDKGNGYYAAAYSVYSIMLIISCYSLPLAVSKVVSSKMSKRQYKSAQRVFQCAMIFALTMGGITFLVCEFLGDFLAQYVMEEPMGALALKVLGPALLTVSVMGVFRGYFQGLGTMMPTAVSQILEQIFVLIGSIAGTYVLYQYGGKVGALFHNEDYAPAYGAAGASIGPVLGSVVGLVFLMMVYTLYRKGTKKRSVRDANGRVDSYPQIFKLIILTIVPVLMSTTVYNISDVVDTKIFGSIMIQKGLGDVKTDIWGVYTGKYKVLVNVPIALANAMCSSIVPVLTQLMVRQEYGRAREKIGQAMRFTMIVAFPSAVGLAVLARPIISMLFKGEVDMAVDMLHVGSLSVVFFAVSTLTNGVLQGINRMKLPVRNAAISLVIHVVFLYAALQLGMGINAVIYANILFAAIVCVLNALSIQKYLKYNQELVRTFAIPAIASVVMGIVIGILNMLLSKTAGNVTTVFVGIGVGAIVYFVVLILLKGINERDLKSMPGGRTILTIARKFRIL
ncbi:MAG: polysaccharide biosynthesis protein [Lachnospiraceae bacterium]|nr:polysaccharide biosynthesis protein [Lachnospiraceae bacterium]MDE7273785.1 polysaccharide biosynthesis protein [Lachnospiraceae bacterium]